jgi:pimeloyl-ACP methyl ester carboxylesterase
VPVTTLDDGRLLHYSEGGDPAGTPVMFFHGCPDTRRVSRSGYDAAESLGIRLVAANRPGYGRSRPAPPSYGTVGDDVAALADRLGISTFAILGMSVGGTFALGCAARHPERVTAAGIVATTGNVALMDPPWPRDDLDPAGLHFFADLAAGSVDDNLARMRPDFLTFCATVDPDDPDDEALAERWVAALPDSDRDLVSAQPVAERAAAAREALGNPDGYLADAALVFRPWDFDVATVRCPVSLWYGELDANAPPRNGHWLASVLPDATLTVLPGVGHLGSLLRNWPTILAPLAATG